MAKENERKSVKQMIFMVQCPFDETHLFERKVDIEEGSDDRPAESEVEAYCPFCDKMLTVKVTGKPDRNTIFYRKFKEQEERLKKKEEKKKKT